MPRTFSISKVESPSKNLHQRRLGVTKDIWGSRNHKQVRMHTTARESLIEIQGTPHTIQAKETLYDYNCWMQECAQERMTDGLTVRYLKGPIGEFFYHDLLFSTDDVELTEYRTNELNLLNALIPSDILFSGKAKHLRLQLGKQTKSLNAERFSLHLEESKQ